MVTFFRPTRRSSRHGSRRTTGMDVGQYAAGLLASKIAAISSGLSAAP
ncbi:MAG: hypothetical protein KatS3mg111_0690 [Pirellulaceae bacterium]|nr:MAG: hypothetical protein KatS3mg111_0690 [Pirellulaceae bacterium]